jgi:hypothetical protein
MKSSATPSPGAQKPKHKSPQKTVDTNRKEADASRVFARISRRNRHAQTTWGHPLAERWGKPLLAYYARDTPTMLELVRTLR